MTGWEFILLGITIFIADLAALVVFVRMLAHAIVETSNRLKKEP